MSGFSIALRVDFSSSRFLLALPSKTTVLSLVLRGDPSKVLILQVCFSVVLPTLPLCSVYLEFCVSLGRVRVVLLSIFLFSRLVLLPTYLSSFLPFLFCCFLPPGISSILPDLFLTLLDV